MQCNQTNLETIAPIVPRKQCATKTQSHLKYIFPVLRIPGADVMNKF